MPSALLERGAEHLGDTLGAKLACKVRCETGAKGFFNLPNALFGAAEGVCAGFLGAHDFVRHATHEDGAVTVTQSAGEVRQGTYDALVVLRTLKCHILTEITAGDNGADGCAISGQGRVEADASRVHELEATSDVIDIEPHMRRQSLRGRILANGLASLLESAPEAFRRA